MKKYLGALCLLIVFSVNAEEKTKDNLKDTKEAIEFGQFIDSRPEGNILFETTTREINFNNKTASITDVGKLSPHLDFDSKNYVRVNEFILDFTNIEINDKFNRLTYPQKRIETECMLKIEEYGLFVEGSFINEKTFVAKNIKPKYLSNITNGYCKKYY